MIKQSLRSCQPTAAADSACWKSQTKWPRNILADKAITLDYMFPSSYGTAYA